MQPIPYYTYEPSLLEKYRMRLQEMRRVS